MRLLFAIGSGLRCRGEKRDPVPDLLTSSAFVGTNATDEPITSGLPVTRAQLHKAPVHRCGPRHTSSFQLSCELPQVIIM